MRLLELGFQSGRDLLGADALTVGFSPGRVSTFAASDGLLNALGGGHQLRFETGLSGVRTVELLSGDHSTDDHWCGKIPTVAGNPIALRQVVLDCTNPRDLAEFYRALLDFEYRPGDEVPAGGRPDPRGADWLVLANPAGGNLAFQRVADLPEPTWPEGPRPQMMHLDLTVGTAAELQAQHERVLGLGARLLYDRFDDPDEPLRVYADPAGHPFCIFVAEPKP